MHLIFSLFRFRYTMLLFLGMFLLIESSAICYAQIDLGRADTNKHCFDFAAVLSADLVQKMDSELRAIEKHFDIDLVCIILPELREEDGDIFEFAAEIFTDWGIGKSTQGSKGFLFLIAMKEQKVKIEVGYDLEEIFPDAYVSQMQNEIFKEMLEQAEWEVAFLASMENMLGRIYKFHDTGIDVATISSSQEGYLSGGAGAATFFDFGAALKKPLPTVPLELREYFSAQPTPELCFERYLVHLAKNISDYTVGLLTAESQEFFKTHPTSTGQRRSELQDLEGLGYYVKQKNSHAVVMFVGSDEKETTKAGVYFIRKTEKGWQMDFNTMTRSLRVVGPGWVMMTERFHPYTEIIMQDYNLMGGFFKRWDDPGGIVPFLRYGSREYYEKIDGCPIRIRPEYKEIGNLRTGDIIVAVNGEKTSNYKQLWSHFQDPIAGRTYAFKVIRDGKQLIVKEILLAYPNGYEEFRKYLQTPRPWIGVYMSQATDREWRRTMKMRDEGQFRYSSLCSILEVCPNSPAAKAGLQPMDLIVDYGTNDDNGEIMAYDIVKFLHKINPGATIEFTIVRDLKHKMIIKITPEQSLNKEFF